MTTEQTPRCPSCNDTGEYGAVSGVACHCATEQTPAQRPLTTVGDVLDAINTVVSEQTAEDIATRALAKWAQVGGWKTIKITLRLDDDKDGFSYDTQLSRAPHRKRAIKAHGGRVRI